MALKMIESRSKNVGQIVCRPVGGSLVDCDLLCHPGDRDRKTGPIESFKRSTSIIRQTGEKRWGQLGIGLIAFLATIPAFLLFFGGGALIANGGAVLGGM